MTKIAHLIRVSDETWAALTAEAEARDYSYRGHLNQGRVVEDLVLQEPAELVQELPKPVVVPEPVVVTMQEPAHMTLKQVIAKWPEKTQARWQLDGWKAKAWCELVLDTIYGR
jgi:hypothetical protein